MYFDYNLKISYLASRFLNFPTILFSLFARQLYIGMEIVDHKYSRTNFYNYHRACIVYEIPLNTS